MQRANCKSLLSVRDTITLCTRPSSSALASLGILHIPTGKSFHEELESVHVVQAHPGSFLYFEKFYQGFLLYIIFNKDS